ncbi:MAG: hypothetical protein EOL89_15275 [Actinobacteria bacterium]|nr:hypothetical protein [Actinomycetota bacterium]
MIISSRRQPLLRPLTQLFVVLASFVLAASPTVAADGGVEPSSSAQCASGQMCFWAGSGYSGQFYARSTTGTLPVSMARSLWNRTGVAVRVYATSNGSGSSTCLAAGAMQSVTTLATGSMRVLPTTTC